MALTAPRQRFELPEPGPRRELQIEARLVDLVVMWNEHYGAPEFGPRTQPGLSTGAVKVSDTDIPTSYRVGPPQRDIDVAIAGARLEAGRILGDRKWPAETGVACREPPLTEAR